MANTPMFHPTFLPNEQFHFSLFPNFQCLSGDDGCAYNVNQSSTAVLVFVGSRQKQVDMFLKSHILDKTYFSVWYAGSSSVAGCIPQNQANKRATLELKRTSKFDGICAITKIQGLCSQKSFQRPYMMSLQQVSMCSTVPILSHNCIFNKKSKFHIKFSQYCSAVDKQVDV
eukprot:jgi/Psemu1/26655/gm1.26655_g